MTVELAREVAARVGALDGTSRLELPLDPLCQPDVAGGVVWTRT
jgi:hypothetical protein